MTPEEMPRSNERSNKELLVHDFVDAPTKIVPVIIKEVLEKVVYVEVNNDIENFDVIDFIEEKLNKDEISLTLEDFKGDSSVNVCINCGNDAPDAIIFHESAIVNQEQ